MTLSFWLDKQYTPRQPLLDVQECEFCIVGGGITGVSFAYHLSKLGKNVVLIEADEICSKASGRSGGLLIPGLEKRYDLCVRDFGRQITDKIWSITAHTIYLMKALSEENHFDCDFKQEGCSAYALTKEELKYILHEHQPGMKFLTSDEAKKQIMPNAIGGLWYEHGASFDPVPFVRGLCNLAEEEGAIIFEDTLAIDIVDQAEHYSVETNKGIVKTKQIIICTNSAAKDLIDVPVNTFRNQLLATSPFKQIITGGHYSADNWHYFKQTSKGNLILGGGRNTDMKKETTDKDDLNEKVQGHLVQYLGNLPLKGSFAVSHRWSGILGFTDDKIPIIDEITNNVHFIGGFSGRGNVLGFLAGKEYSNFLVNGESELPLEIFRKDRF